MAEPEGRAGVESTGEIDAAGHTPIDMERIRVAAETATPRRSLAEITAEVSGVEDEPASKGAEPPRRRLVAELLEGQEALQESTRPGLQIVAPPLHLETSDAGQPIYQLDLSGAEPRAVLVDPDGRELAPADDDLGVEADAREASRSPGVGREAIKKLIMQRDRQVMAAERDGVGAYELAVGLDAFVDRIAEAARDDDA